MDDVLYGLLRPRTMNTHSRKHTIVSYLAACKFSEIKLRN